MKTTDEKMREDFERVVLNRFGHPVEHLVAGEMMWEVWQAALSQPAAEGWKLKLTSLLHDYLDFNIQTDGLAERTRNALAMLAATPTPPQEQPNAARLPNGAVVTNVYEAYEEGRRAQEQPEAVEPVAWMWRRHYSGGEFITGLKPTQEQARALCELFEDGGTYDEVKPLFDLSPTAIQALRMAAEHLRDQISHSDADDEEDFKVAGILEIAATQIESLIPPTSEQDSAAQGASESDQRKLGFAEGWKEAAIAWEVCASLHREYAKGKDPLYTTRQSDFVKHANAARVALASTPPTDTEPLTVDGVGACPTCRSVGFEASILGPDRCTFCDGTEGGNPPDTVTMTRSELEAFGMHVASAVDNSPGGEFGVDKRAIVAQHMPEVGK